MCKRTQYLHNFRKSVPLHRVFHSIRFKVNKGWSSAELFMPLSEQRETPQLEQIS